MFRSVDFPQPDGPTMQMNSRGRTSSVTRSRACVVWRVVRNRLEMPRRASTGCSPSRDSEVWLEADAGAFPGAPRCAAGTAARCSTAPPSSAGCVTMSVMAFSRYQLLRDRLEVEAGEHLVQGVEGVDVGEVRLLTAEV